jgi:hypothetical protein
VAEKSRLEIAVSYVALVVAGLWAVFGFRYNMQKDTFDKETKKYALVADLFKKCTSTDQIEQKSALQFLGLYSSATIDPGPINEIFGGADEVKKFVSACATLVSAQVADQRPDQKTTDPSPTASQAAAAAPPPAAPRSAGPPATPSASPNDGQRFWIYIGNFKDGRWTNRYLDFPDNFDPAKFSVATDSKRGVYRVRNQTGALNVRFGSFSATGDFPPPTSRPLQPGQEIQMKSAAQWFDSGNWWATIDPPT